MTSDFKYKFFKTSEDLSNVTLVAMDGKSHCTHAVLLASVSNFLKDLLLDMSCPSDQVVILLPDTSWEEVEECLEALIRKDGDRENNSVMNMMGIKFVNRDKRNIFLDNFEKNQINMGVRVVSEESNTNKNENLNTSENTCPFCSETFMSVKRMQCHVSINHIEENKNYEVAESKYNDQHICRFCKCSFTKTTEYKNHIATEHSSIAPLKRKCEECQKHFKNNNSFTKHMRCKHAIIQTFTCRVCQKQLISTSKGILRKHMRTAHANVPFYKCEICPKSFVKESTFYDHKNSHNNFIICDLCGMDFTRQHNLDKHSLKIHGTEDEKNRAKKFACNVCSFRSYTNDRLKGHEQIHSINYNFRCDQCDFRSRTYDNLRRHIGSKHLGKWEITYEMKNITNAKRRQSKQNKKIENGGLYRAGQERETFNKYMRELQHKERVTCGVCHKETTNLDWHHKMRCNRF